MIDGINGKEKKPQESPAKKSLIFLQLDALVPQNPIPPLPKTTHPSLSKHCHPSSPQKSLLKERGLVHAPTQTKTGSSSQSELNPFPWK